MIKEINNRYVSKEVLERYLRHVLVFGIQKQELFLMAVEQLIEVKQNEKKELQNLNCIETFLLECE